MAKDDRKLLDVLKSELAFLKAGGYRNAPSAPWRSPLIFQDSPTCLNFDRTKHPQPCHECVMASLVPPDCLGERFPCRHIPLNNAGFTIDTYDRLGTFPEAEAAVESWLQARIAELEAPPGSPPTP
jgi:hypothetical protein